LAGGGVAGSKKGVAPQPFRSSRRLTRLPIQTTSMQLKKLLLQARWLPSLSLAGHERAVSFAFCSTARRLHCVRIICERPPTRNPIIHVPLAHQLCVSALSVFYCCFSGQTHARVNHFTFAGCFFILLNSRGFYLYENPTVWLCGSDFQQIRGNSAVSLHMASENNFLCTVILFI
jgi:hypothetical protein